MPLRKSRKEQLIKSVPLFSRCTKRELSALATQADELALPEKKDLCREGEPGREFMLIVAGAAKVTKNGRTINRLGAGDFVGEIALLTGSPRTATVTTTEPASVLVLTDRAFHRVAKEIPSVHASLLKALSERLQADAL
ncbi:MAG: cyclic nucleotide-binding domain-containing protein [Gaiellaceae bacterium]